MILQPHRGHSLRLWKFSFKVDMGATKTKELTVQNTTLHHQVPASECDVVVLSMTWTWGN